MGLIADMQGLAAPTAATLAKAIAPGGEIIDYGSASASGDGMLQSVLLTLQEAKTKLGGISGTAGIIGDTDASDPNLTTLQTVYNGL